MLNFYFSFDGVSGVQLKVAYSMGHLGGALGGAGAPAHACFLPETKRARERAFHPFCMPLSIIPAYLISCENLTDL